MSDEPIKESREGQRARIFRARVTGALEEVIDILEEARKEGFIIQFSIPQTPDGTNMLTDEAIVVMKRW